MINFLIVLFVVRQCLAAMDPAEMAEFLKYVGAAGTQHGKAKNDPQYYTTNSYLPHLPTLSGYMGTHGTYRFMSIHEQTAVIIGDGKHGLWRIQESGFIREYRRKGKEGLPDGTDPNKLDGNQVTDILYLGRINVNYAAYIPEESWSGYKYPTDRVSNGKADNITGHLNFIDLSIYHPKYKGKYNTHVAIDLPHFYCTMTKNDYTHVKTVWKYAVAQPLANRLGPLGIRAGLDIKELYTNVLRFDLFSDAGVWANIGVGDETTDKIVRNLQELKERYQTVNYQRVDFSKVNVEAYLYERPFFNVPYIFVTFVMDNKQPPSDYSYVRPNGAYWDGLVARHKSEALINNTVAVPYPKAYIRGISSPQTAYGLPLYGHHHPNRIAHGLTGGACPNRGGDWSTYPWGNSGSGWPTNYQEITPMCDGFVLDMKMWMNLQEPTWDNENLFLGNAGFKGKVVINYTSDANLYGKYTDKYLDNTTNPYLMDLTKNGTIVKPRQEPKPPLVVFRMNFTRPGKFLTYNSTAKSDDTSNQPIATTQTSTLQSTGQSTQPSTQQSSQSSTGQSTQKSTKSSSQQPTQPSTQQPVQSSTQQSSQPSTQKSSQQSTQKSNQPSTRQSTRPSTQNTASYSYRYSTLPPCREVGNNGNQVAVNFSLYILAVIYTFGLLVRDDIL